MWRIHLAYCVFLVFFHNTYCCYCNQQHGLVNTKGETGFDFKRQLDIEEYSATEFEVENVSRGIEPDETNFTNDTISIENSTTIEVDNETTPTTILTADESVTTVLVNVTTTEISTTEELSTAIVTSASSELNSTTERAITETSEITETSAIETNAVTETSEVSEAKASSEVNDSNLLVTEPSYTALNTHKDVSMYCNKYKKSTSLDLNKMADIWKIAYYTMPHKLKCFKLHIKLLTTEDQQYYSKVYGNFNNKINWSKCKLEIMSRDNNNFTSNRKHFLQDYENIQGVMKNIIIEEEYSANTSSISLVQEVPDQWLVVKNLLLMRDCNTGELVVFTRVPMEPKIIDIEDALSSFDEPRVLTGTRACL